MTEWHRMNNAPKDGRPVRVLVLDEGRAFRELPYRLRWIDGRWCYDRNRAPVFAWHAPRRWFAGEAMS